MKKWIVTLITLSILAVAFSAIATPTASKVNDTRVVALVNEMQALSADQIEQLPAIEMQPYTLPTSSVDVMRVRLEETYTVEGVGEDTVELSGWIAVRHSAPRVVNTSSPLSWDNFVVDTEFVGLKLSGQSDIFGPVEVSLDADRPAIGEVGSDVIIPENARAALASYKLAADTTTASECRAPVNVSVEMPDLGLTMKTNEAATWHSQVTTIPPVGHVASVTVAPVSLVQDGRTVGTLVSGTVKFREVVAKKALVAVDNSTVAP